MVRQNHVRRVPNRKDVDKNYVICKIRAKDSVGNLHGTSYDGTLRGRPGRLCNRDPLRRLPVRIHGFPGMFVFYWHGHCRLQLLFGSRVHLPCAMKPGTPVFTISLSLCLV